MRNLVTLLLLVLSVSLSAQSFELDKTDKSVEPTETTIIVENVEFPGIISSSGTMYITKVVDGKVKKQYVGTKTEYKLEEYIVYTNLKETKYWILKLTKNQTMKRVYVNKTDT